MMRFTRILQNSANEFDTVLLSLYCVQIYIWAVPRCVERAHF